MPTTTEVQRATGELAESTTEEVLRAQGYAVTNLNELAGNCPFMDLLAVKGTDRLLIQVRGTRTNWGGFATPPAKAWALHRLADALDCHGLYAFVHFCDGGAPAIRFATAAQVAVLAEEDEANYPKKNKFHVNIDLFTTSIDQIGSLLTDQR